MVGLRLVPALAPASHGPAVPNLGAAAREASLWLLDALTRPVAGRRLAIAVGSRGMSGLVPLVAQVAGLLRVRGAFPLIVAAMGSHGGGTPAGRRAVLSSLGVDEESVGAPVACGETTGGPGVRTGWAPSGRPVFCLPDILSADGIIVVNRVHTHTAFDGQVQSGLLKMVAVGLGGPEGAAVVHQEGASRMEEAIVDLARHQVGRLPILGGIATVEDAEGHVAALEPAAAGWAAIASTDARCLALARALAGRLPAAEVDLLLVDRMGKDIVGTGMDPLVIGRRRVWGHPEPARPRVGRLVVFRLTPGAAGNANGVGLADFTTRRLAEAIDWPATVTNALTTTFTQRIALPPVLETDQAAVEAALLTLGAAAGPGIRAMRISDTAHLGRVSVSEALLGELEAAGWVREGEVEPLPFAPDGELTDL